MYLQVTLVGVLAGEDLPARFTLELKLGQMGPFVRPQATCSVETLATLRTTEAFFVFVHFLMFS